MRGLLVCLLSTMLIVGCAGPFGFENSAKVPRPTFNVPDKTPPIVHVKSKSLDKHDSLVHILPVNFVKVVSAGDGINFAGGTLGEFVKYLKGLGVDAVCAERDLCYRQVPAVSNKFLDNALDMVASAAGVYWTVEDGVIKFVREKVVTYSLPFLSDDILKGIYAVDDNDKLASNLKESVFKEIKDALEEVLFYKKTKGSQETQYTVERKIKAKNEGKSKKESAAERVSESVNESKLQSSSKESASSTAETVESKKSESTSTSTVGVESDKSKKKGSQYPLMDESNSEKDVTKLTSDSDRKSEKISDKTALQSKEGKTGNKDIEKSGRLRAETVTKEKVSNYSEKVLIKQVYDEKKKLAVLSKSGLVVVRVTRSEEPLVDAVIRRVVSEVMNNLVVFDVYVVEISADKSLQIKSGLDFLRRKTRYELGLSIKDQQAGLDVTNLATNYLSGIAYGYSLNFMLSFLVNNGNGKIVSSSTLMAMPRTVARIKSTVGIPYLEPEDVSVGGTNPTQSYEVKYIEDGMEVRLLPTVIGNDLFVTLTAYVNQYLGDKTVQVGNFGTFTLPIQSPKVITTTFRCRPGDVIFIGGLKKVKMTKRNGWNLVLPNDVGYEKSYREIYVVVRPRLIKFVPEGTDSSWSGTGRNLIIKSE